MKLVVGLGNPEEKHAQNRHNVGFMFVDFFAQQLEEKDQQWRNKITILKPQTFMNQSGEAVREQKNFFKIPLDDIFVAHDDLDLRLGEFKIQKGKGPHVHNGILSVEKELGAGNFYRIRIGVDNRDPENRLPGSLRPVLLFTIITFSSSTM